MSAPASQHVGRSVRSRCRRLDLRADRRHGGACAVLRDRRWGDRTFPGDLVGAGLFSNTRSRQRTRPLRRSLKPLPATCRINELDETLETDFAELDGLD
jgi:hypothetical protein